VRSVTFERNRPLSGSGSLGTLRPPGFAADAGLVTWFEEVGPRYVETLGLRLIAGRDLRAEDDLDAPKVALINESAARLFFPGQDPLGRLLGRDIAIVGVVGDVLHQNLRDAPRVTVYLPALQDPRIRDTSLLVRTTTEPLAFAPAVRQIVRAIEPRVPVMSVTTLGEVAARSLRTERLLATLAGAFGVLALLLAATGLSGMLAFGVTRRSREIGVRMALGASLRRVVAMVLREAALVVAAGLALGVPCAFLAARAARSMLFGLSPSDPWTLAVAAVAVVVASLLAAVWPARRAAAVTPLVALRSE
jgi:predicted permease